MNRMTFRIDVPESREIRLQLPQDAPMGEAELDVTFKSGIEIRESRIGDLLDPEIFGAWKDRTDIGDSVEFARKLRERVWRRDR